MLRTRTFRPVAGWLLVAAACGAPPGACQAVAQQRTADREIAIDIPSLPLDAALARYFRATGVQLLYDAALANGRRSSAVRGSYAPREALRRLLAGTGLVARYSRTNAAILMIPSAASAEGAPVPLGRVVIRERIAASHVSPVARLAYYDVLETALQERLRADRRTGRLAFTVLVDLTVTGDGRVVGVRLARGTGATRGDAQVAEVLTETLVPAPPDGLVQPLRLSLKGRSR